jgi:pilus assembly protein Flp/PilA
MEMTRLWGFFARLRENDKGATLIEYSILIGLISALAIASVLLMGQWVASQWAYLVSIVPPPGGS